MLDGRISSNHSGSVTDRRGKFDCEEEDFCCWATGTVVKRIVEKLLATGFTGMFLC